MIHKETKAGIFYGIFLNSLHKRANLITSLSLTPKLNIEQILNKLQNSTGSTIHFFKTKHLDFVGVDLFSIQQSETMREFIKRNEYGFNVVLGYPLEFKQHCLIYKALNKPYSINDISLQANFLLGVTNTMCNLKKLGHSPGYVSSIGYKCIAIPEYPGSEPLKIMELNDDNICIGYNFDNLYNLDITFNEFTKYTAKRLESVLQIPIELSPIFAWNA